MVRAGRAGLASRRRANGLRWYQVVYRLFYRLGVIVWQRPAPPADLVELVEGPAALPPGRALDLGCGTGTDTIYLAGHGWQVTSIDMVAKAVAVARRKAAAAGVAPRFVEGDVTRLRDLGIGGGYTLLVDFGCFHTLPTDRRVGYVLGVTDAAAPAATLLLYGFARPPKAAPMHAGITDDEVRQRFTPEWEIISVGPAEADALGVGQRRADRRFDLRCYQLRRSPPSGSDHPLPENRVTRGAGAVDESSKDSAATSRPLDRDR